LDGDGTDTVGEFGALFTGAEAVQHGFASALDESPAKAQAHAATRPAAAWRLSAYQHPPTDLQAPAEPEPPATPAHASLP
jgi:hypothetical protein